MSLTELLIRDKEKILKLIEARLSSFHSIKNAEIRLNELTYQPFNQNYSISEVRFEEHKDFFYESFAHQANYSYHPMTCGVSSNHDLLLPRLTEKGSRYYICPTCGYIQEGF